MVKGYKKILTRRHEGVQFHGATGFYSEARRRLRLDDDEESPLVVQEALKGIRLVEPDGETLYRIYQRVLHECEEIRFRKELKHGSHG